MPNQSIDQIIIQQVRSHKGLAAVLLYGSQVKGVAKPTSDIDIAVLYEERQIPTPGELWELKEKLADALQHEVDLVCLNRADPIIASQIYKYHRIILVNNPKKLEDYFMRLCSDYAELKEFIRPMEDRILERKYYDRS